MPDKAEDKRVLSQLNQIRLEVKELRRELGIDDGSLVFKLKRLLKNKQKERNNISSNLQNTYIPSLTHELNKLTQYKKKLEMLKKWFFFIPVILTIWEILKSRYLLILSSKFYKELQQDKTTVFILGAIDYKYRYQRPQHLAAQLVKRGNRVVYIDTEFNPIHKFDAQYFLLSKIKDNLFVANLSATRRIHIHLQSPSYLDKVYIVNSFNNLINKIKNNNRRVLLIDHPFWSFVLDKIEMPTIYDCMDEHESFDVSMPDVAHTEENLVKKSKLVIAASDRLLEKITKEKASKTLLLKNAGEYDHFAKALTCLPIPDDMKGMEGKVIGYYGAIAEWFDEDLILKLAKAYPKDSIVLIGQVTHPTLKIKAQAYRNIHFLGEKPYSELPKYLKRFDVCLIPFVLNDLIKATNPVKIYEYFASGKPVVSTNLPELQEYRDIMYLAVNAEIFIKHVNRALNENDEGLSKERRMVAQNNTWDKRGDILNQQLISLAG